MLKKILFLIPFITQGLFALAMNDQIDQANHIDQAGQVEPITLAAAVDPNIPEKSEFDSLRAKPIEERVQRRLERLISVIYEIDPKAIKPEQTEQIKNILGNMIYKLEKKFRVADEDKILASIIGEFILKETFLEKGPYFKDPNKKFKPNNIRCFNDAKVSIDATLSWALLVHINFSRSDGNEQIYKESKDAIASSVEYQEILKYYNDFKDLINPKNGIFYQDILALFELVIIKLVKLGQFSKFIEDIVTQERIHPDNFNKYCSNKCSLKFTEAELNDKLAVAIASSDVLELAAVLNENFHEIVTLNLHNKAYPVISPNGEKIYYSPIEFIIPQIGDYLSINMLHLLVELINEGSVSAAWAYHVYKTLVLPFQNEYYRAWLFSEWRQLKGEITKKISNRLNFETLCNRQDKIALFTNYLCDIEDYEIQFYDYSKIRDCYKTKLFESLSNPNAIKTIYYAQKLDNSAYILEHYQDEKDQNPLHYAFRLGNQELTEKLIEILPSILISKSDKFGDTPIHIAIQEGHDQIVKNILDKLCPGEIPKGSKDDVQDKTIEQGALVIS